MKQSKYLIVLVAFTGVSLVLGGCQYLGLMRPRVLEQLNPEMVQLMNELPEVDAPNKEVVAQLFAHGGLSHAKKDEDDVYRIGVRVPEGQYIWEPAILVMEEGGELEIEFTNEDSFSHHAAFVQNNGGRINVTLPVHERGKVRVQLDSPGMYWFGCPVSNHVMRGMLGMILVGGEVPPEAKLDCPPQSRSIVVPIKSHPDTTPSGELDREE